MGRLNKKLANKKPIKFKEDENGKKAKENSDKKVDVKNDILMLSKPNVKKSDVLSQIRDKTIKKKDKQKYKKVRQICLILKHHL